MEIAEKLTNIQDIVNQTNIFAYAIPETIYDNPILNHPELIKNIATKFGSNIVNKLINFGIQFTYSSEDKNMLEDICNEHNSFETVSLLIGLDTIVPVTYH